MKDLLIDSSLENDTLMVSFKWWEKRRPLYNVLVGVSGIVPLLLFQFKYFALFTLAGICIYALMANICYCMGFMIELFLKHYFKSSINFVLKRFGLYLVGTAFSVVVTLVAASLVCFLSESKF